MEGFEPYTGQSTGARSGIDALTKSPQAQEYWVKRLIALIIDYVIIGIAVWVIGLLVSIPAFVIRAFTGIPSITPLDSIFSFIPFGILAFFYFSISEVSMGETLGKYLLHLKVARVNGGRVTISQVFIRNISKIYWLLLLLDVVVGLAVEADYKQKFSDKFAGTIVTG
jgi:uncharacterized RDD family membrane protein YckC